MKLLKRYIKKNPVTLNIPVYSIGGSIDRLNFFLNSLLLFFIMFFASIQYVSSASGYFGKYLVIGLTLVLLVNNSFKRIRDINGKEISFSDKCFFAFLAVVPFVNVAFVIYLSYKIGYLEIIKRRNALLKELI